jgi:hypothetical protein
MKNLLFTLLATFLFCFALNAQWVQIGDDIDGESPQDHSGRSLGLSTDGSTVAIGATGNNDAGAGAGHVRVYRNIAGIWTQIGDDIDGESESDQSGSSVSINGNGTRVAIASPHHAGINGAFSGQVRVYEETDGNWIQVGVDIEGEALGDESGTEVSLNADGTIIAIGAEGNAGSGSGSSGHVRMYQESNGEWSQLGADIDAAFTIFALGNSVSLNSDGQIVAIGARGNGTSISGVVQIFQFDNVEWVQVGSNIPSISPIDLTGVSVSLSSDGSIVALGSPLHTPFVPSALPDAGAVRVFQNIDNVWTQIGSDIYGQTAGDHAGWMGGVKLSSDGGTLAVGSPDHGSNPFDAGSVRVFQNIDGDWVQQGENIIGEASNDNSGSSVGLSGDGTIVAIGAQDNEGTESGGGHVRVYQYGTTSLSEIQLKRIRVFPNPSSGIIRIDLNETVQGVTLHIFNAQGVKLQTDKIGTLASFNYALPESSGLYLIQLITKQGETRTMTVIKE